MHRRLLWSLCQYALGFGALAFVIWQNWSTPAESGGGGIVDALARPIQVLSLILTIIFCMAALSLTFVRWYILVRAQDLPFTLRSAFRLGLIGVFFSTFLPGAIGGDIVKAACIAREQSRRTVAVATVLMDRAVGLWGLVWLVALIGCGFWLADNPTLAEQSYLQWIVMASVAVVGVTVTGWAILGMLPDERADRFAERLESATVVGGAFAELWRSVWMYRCRGRSVIVALSSAVASHASFVVTFYFAANVLQPAAQDAAIPSFLEHALIVPMGEFVQAFFPSPGGLGGTEYIYGKLYGLVGQPNSNGVLGALTYRLILFGIGITGYFVYTTTRSALARQKAGTADLAIVEV